MWPPSNWCEPTTTRPALRTGAAGPSVFCGLCGFLGGTLRQHHGLPEIDSDLDVSKPLAAWGPVGLPFPPTRPLRPGCYDPVADA